MAIFIRSLNQVLPPLTSDRKAAIRESLDGASSPGFDYFLLTVLSATIATLGLLTNSAAVIIGAMLVAPLMSPILGVSLASITGDQRIFRNATIAIVFGAMLSILLSWVLSGLSIALPFQILAELPAEVLARTRPSPFDLVIAIAGGAAASYAIARENLSEALPGVAIATALMPPLCTIGVGLAVNSSEVTFGASLLFLTNLASISFSGIVVFFLLGFRPPDWYLRLDRGVPQSVIWAGILVALVSVPLVVYTLTFVRDAQQAQQIRNAVEAAVAELDDVSLQDVDYSVTSALDGTETVRINLTVRSLESNAMNFERTVALQTRIATELQRQIALVVQVVPSAQLDPLVPPTQTPTNTAGPTPTPTITRTPSLTPTVTPSTTPTATLTRTSSPTPTYTPSPTPLPVLVDLTFPERDITLRANPGGPIIERLPDDTPVELLFGQEVVIGDTVWARVRLADGREGWLVADRLVALTATPTKTPSRTPTATNTEPSNVSTPEGTPTP